MFTAFFDTCVLYPIVKTDLALRCAQQGMFAIRWSDQVLEELTRVLQDPPASLERTKAERRIQMMNTAFPQAEVRGWEPLGWLSPPRDLACSVDFTAGIH